MGNTRTTSHWAIVLISLYSGFYTYPVCADEIDDLTDMSLESLMNVEVTSAAKKQQQVSDSTAAIYVISREDIRRSGATTLAEALRLAPGVDVARLDANKAAVSMRGFNTYALPNKTLVLIDGRSIYTAPFAVVFWEHQDALMADIDRIEVIRGPGGTLWGANAVNGVINIITRDASETQGGLVEGLAGNGAIGKQAGMRYGGKLGDDAAYRVYGKYSDFGSFETATGANAHDERRMEQAGGRLDWRPTPRDHVTLQGDIYDGNEEQVIRSASLMPPGQQSTVGDADYGGGNALFRWTHDFDGGDQTTLQLYYDRFTRDGSLMGHYVDTFDSEFQHLFNVSERVEFLWGLGYRHIELEMEDRPNFRFSPQDQELDLFNAFVQGDFQLTETVRLTLGSKFEHNDFTGMEYQPNVRMLWQPASNHSVWGSVSRAIRTPSPYESSFRGNAFAAPGTPPLLFSQLGNPDLEAEKLTAYELGYRTQLRPDLSFDIATFYNDYDDLISFEPSATPVFETTPPPPHLTFFNVAGNQLIAESYGLEAVTEWQATDNWRLVGIWSMMKASAHTKPGGMDTVTEAAIEGDSPEQQLQLRSYLDLPHNLEFDTTLYWVAQRPNQNIDNVFRADFHLGWQPNQDLRLGLFLQNAFNDSHAEYGQFILTPTEMPRTVFARAEWRW